MLLPKPDDCFHYGHGLMKIVFICHYSPGASLKMGSGCYHHVLVLLAEKSQYSKGVLTLKLNHLSIVRHYRLVKLPMQLNALRMVLGADNVCWKDVVDWNMRESLKDCLDDSG